MRGTLLALIAAPGLCFASQAPNADANLKVSFDEPVGPLSRIIPKLAELTHKPLKASAAVMRQIVCIRVHDVTVEDLMQRVASATGDAWSTTADGIYLSPSEGARQSLTARGTKSRAAMLAKDIDAISPEAIAKRAKESEGGASSPSMNYMDMFGSGDPIYYEFLSGIGANLLATLPPNGRAVFSSNPNARQFPLPGDALREGRAFIERRNAAAKKAAAAEAAQGNDPEAVVKQTFAQVGPQEVIQGSLSKVDFVISDGGPFMSMVGNAGLNCSLVLYDSKGDKIGEDQYMIGEMGIFDQQDMQDAMAAAQNKPTSAPKAQSIVLSPDTKAFIQAFRNLGMPSDASQTNAMNPTLRKQVMDRLMNPDAYDPLAYPADMIIGAAKVKNLQLVACLPDSFAVWFSMLMMMGAPTADRILTKLQTDPTLALDQKDGWLTVAPTNFSSDPLDRTALAKMQQQLLGKVEPTLDDLVDLARLGCGKPDKAALLEIWLMLTDPSRMMTMMMQDWQMLELYGSLSITQKLTLANEKRISIGSLDPQQRDLADQLVYGASSASFMSPGGTLMIEQKTTEDPLLGSTAQDMNSMFEEYGMDGTPPQDYRAEPTEVAPGGLPGNCYLTLRTSNSDVARPVPDKKGSGPVSFMEMDAPIEQLASTAAMMEMPNMQAYAQGMGKVDKVYLGTKHSYHFRIYASGESFHSSVIQYSDIDTSVAYGLHNLPAALQKRFDLAFKQAKDSMKDANTAGLGDVRSGNAGASGP